MKIKLPFIAKCDDYHSFKYLFEFLSNFDKNKDLDFVEIDLEDYPDLELELGRYHAVFFMKKLPSRFSNLEIIDIP